MYSIGLPNQKQKPMTPKKNDERKILLKRCWTLPLVMISIQLFVFTLVPSGDMRSLMFIFSILPEFLLAIALIITIVLLYTGNYSVNLDNSNQN